MEGWKVKRGTKEVPVPSDEVLRQWAKEKRFAASDLIYNPQTREWQAARDTEMLRDAFVEERYLLLRLRSSLDKMTKSIRRRTSPLFENGSLRAAFVMMRSFITPCSTDGCTSLS